MVVNYMSAHDNNTLWDKLELSNGSDTVEERLAMNRLGASILMISKGMVFFQAGEEMLRTKGGDENSYKSSDAVNNINWSVLKEGSAEYEMMQFYKGLIKLRQTYTIFRSTNTAVMSKDLKDGRFAVTIDDHNGGKAMIITNPTAETMCYTANGSWYMVSDGASVLVDAPVSVSGDISIPAYSAVILINNSIMTNN